MITGNNIAIFMKLHAYYSLARFLSGDICRGYAVPRCAGEMLAANGERGDNSIDLIKIKILKYGNNFKI